MSINPYLYYQIKKYTKEMESRFGRVYRKNRQILDEKKKLHIKLREMKEDEQNKEK